MKIEVRQIFSLSGCMERSKGRSEDVLETVGGVEELFPTSAQKRANEGGACLDFGECYLSKYLRKFLNFKSSCYDAEDMHGIIY